MVVQTPADLLDFDKLPGGNDGRAKNDPRYARLHVIWFAYPYPDLPASDQYRMHLIVEWSFFSCSGKEKEKKPREKRLSAGSLSARDLPKIYPDPFGVDKLRLRMKVTSN